MNRIGRHFRSQFVGYLALFIALGGISYAATQLPKNSVKAKQIAPNAVTSSEVKNASLTCKDVKKESGLCAAPNVTIRSSTVTIPFATCSNNGMGGRNCFSSASTLVTVSCQAGETAISGGFAGTESNGAPTRSTTSAGTTNGPVPATGTPTGWAVSAFASGSSTTMTDPPPPTFTAYALCAS